MALVGVGGTDRRPPAAASPWNSPKAPSRLVTEPSPMLCSRPPPPAPPGWATLLAATSPGGMITLSRRPDVIADRHPDLVLTLAVGRDRQVARLAGLEQVNGLGHHLDGGRGRLGRTGAGAAGVWAVATDPPRNMIPPTGPRPSRPGPGKGVATASRLNLSGRGRCRRADPSCRSLPGPSLRQNLGG